MSELVPIKNNQIDNNQIDNNQKGEERGFGGEPRSSPNLIDYFSQTKKDWYEFLKPFIMDDIVPILKYLDDKTLPAKNEIFRFTHFPLDNIKFVIIGMDPYFNRGLADGLAFSSRDIKCPASLNRIFGVLQKNGLIKDKPLKYTLEHWALQGCLLLNTALTVEESRPGSHMKLWRPFMTKFIQSLSAKLADKQIIWCLWGKDAQSIKPLISTQHHQIFEHCHPVAITTPSFSDCNHFAEIAKIHPNFIWDYRLTKTDFFTDGACKGNQFTNGKASWGCVCTAGILKDQSWADALQTTMIENVEARPTNIRAEGMALVCAFEKAIGLAKYGISSRIFSDSKFWIDDMFTQYIPNWVANSIPFTKKKNSDLTTLLWSLYQKSLPTGLIQLVFVNAWHDRPEPTESYDKYIWIGNQKAEQAAEAKVPPSDGTEKILSYKKKYKGGKPF